MSAPPALLLAVRLFPETERLVEIGVRIGLTLVVGFLIQRTLFLLIGRLERLMTRGGRGGEQGMQRSRTLGQILRSLATTLVVAGVLLHVLGLLGWDIKPLIAGAGIVGVALGFGAQQLVRDVIAGVFILVENQFGVGDIIEINGKAATVEEVTVRSTVLRDFNGYQYFVPNGEMRVVTNHSRDWNRLVVDSIVAADENVDRALEVCRRVVDEFNAEAQWRERLLDPVAVWGLESVSGQEASLRTVVRAHPGAAAPEAARELRRRIHRALLAEGLRPAATREMWLLAPERGGSSDLPTPPA